MIPQPQQEIYSLQTHQMMPAEPNSHKSIRPQNFPSQFYPKLSLKYKENGAQLNERPMEFTMLSPSRIITSKVQIS